MRILRPQEIYLMRMTGRSTICNLGGSSKSDSSTRTDNTTNNDVKSTDMRNVASDAAVAISGSNNNIDRSTSNLTSFVDNSNRSSLTSFVDTSIKDSSTKFTDNSDRSVTTINTNTDYGSVNGSLSLAGKMTDKAFDTAALGISGAIDVLKLESSNNLKAVSLAFDSAKGQSALANQSSAAVMGFASEALKATQAAVADAKDGGQTKMIMGALAVAGVVGLAYAVR